MAPTRSPHSRWDTYRQICPAWSFRSLCSKTVWTLSVPTSSITLRIHFHRSNACKILQYSPLPRQWSVQTWSYPLSQQLAEERVKDHVGMNFRTRPKHVQRNLSNSARVSAGWLHKVQWAPCTAFWSKGMTGVYACLCEAVCDVTTVLGHLKGKLYNHKLWYERFFSVESNGEGPRSKFEREDGQTDGQKWPKNLGWRRRAAGMSHGARRQQFAAASRFWSIPNLMPRSTVTRVWLTEWAHLGQLCGTLTSDNPFFFFFF